MALLSKERNHEILRQLTTATSFDGVLALFGAEIMTLGIADAYLINMLDAPGKNLVNRRLQFTPEFHNAEQTFFGYRNPVDNKHLNSRTFRQRRIIRVDAQNATETEARILQYWKVQEMTGIPLLASRDNPEMPIGTIVLMKQQGRIADKDFDSLNELISLFHTSLENWLRYSHLQEIHDQARTAAEESTRLLQFIVEMNSLTSVSKIQELFAAEIFRQLAFDLAAFLLVENDQLLCTKVSVASSKFEGIGKELERFLTTSPYPVEANAGAAIHVLLRNEPILFPNVSEIRHLPMSERDSEGLAILKTVRTLFASPIRYQKNPIGILALYSLTEPVPLSEADRHLLDQLSTFLGTALTNGKIYETSQEQSQEIGRLNLKLQEKVKDLAEQASTDQLTGLFNFRAFEKQLAKRLIESQRKSNENDLSIVLVDIDHFKIFNDTHGHAAGNDVLVGVAQEIGKLIRQTDMACRYGGEEFVVILPKCDLDGAVRLAERIRIAVETSSFETDEGKRSVTVSVGCTVHEGCDTPLTLFKRADQALYRAKSNGRNQVVSA